MPQPTVLSVELGQRRYPIVLGNGLGQRIQKTFAAHIAKGRRVVAVVDQRFARKNPGFAEALGAEVILFPTSERTKTLRHLEKLLSELSRRKVDRTGILAAVGGGVLGDMVGFAAASYLRGVDFYQIPTTLLAMVDSSVGGKTGVNLPEGKNLVGAFHQPLGVFADTALLRTLPPREFNAGAAEIVKTALLADAKWFARLESVAPLGWDSPQLPDVIRDCCALKADVVRKDERETAKTGGRALLNLGHTFGHTVEKVGGYGNYLHGEAVALGLVMAAELSVRLGLLKPEGKARIVALQKKQGLPVRLRAPLPLDALVDALGRDKKVRAGLWRFVVLSQLGKARVRADIPPAQASEVFLTIGAK